MKYMEIHEAPQALKPAHQTGPKEYITWKGWLEVGVGWLRLVVVACLLCLIGCALVPAGCSVTYGQLLRCDQGLVASILNSCRCAWWTPGTTASENSDFSGALRLPLPDKMNGSPSGGAGTLRIPRAPLATQHFWVMTWLPKGPSNNGCSQPFKCTKSLLANLITGSATVRPSTACKGFETWRRIDLGNSQGQVRDSIWFSPAWYLWPEL